MALDEAEEKEKDKQVESLEGQTFDVKSVEVSESGVLVWSAIVRVAGVRDCVGMSSNRQLTQYTLGVGLFLGASSAPFAQRESRRNSIGIERGPPARPP